MTSKEETADAQRLLGRTTEATIRIALILGIVSACFLIVRAFLMPAIWGVIIAVALQPLYRRVRRLIGGRGKTAATLIVGVALALLAVPTVRFVDSIVVTSVDLTQKMIDGTLELPPPPESVEEWPVVGKPIAEGWAKARTDTADAVERFAPQLATVAKGILSALAGLGVALLYFFIAMLLAGVFLATGERGDQFVRRLSVRLAGEERGHRIVDLSAATVRSVAVGVVGVAAIQAVLAGLGMWAAGVPGASIWTLLILVLAIIQLPPLLVILPVVLYLFSTASMPVAVGFAVWGTLVSFSDTFLKPLLMGRGVDVPTLVILVGSIGGMMAFGILGLFVGAVILAVGYKLAMAWIEAGEADAAEPAPAEDPAT